MSMEGGGEGVRTARERIERVLAWARVEVGCRGDDAGCRPVLSCRECGELVPAEVVVVGRDGGPIRCLCFLCEGPVTATPF